MIKPRDLTEGNYVIRDGIIRKIISVGHIFKQCILVGIEGDLGNPTVNIRHLFPLPLTKQLLESVGFECCDFDLNAAHLYRIDAGDSTDSQIYVNIKTGNLSFNDDFYNVKLQGFHHLQNIIYSLTGKELTLNQKADETNS